MSAAEQSPPVIKGRSLRNRLLRNFAWVGSSQAVIAVLGLLSLALTARTLGPAGLGILAVIEAYTRLIGRLAHPEPWQALIQYGTRAQEQDDRQAFGRLGWLSLMVDVTGGLLAAGLAIALAGWASGWMRAAEGHAALLMIGGVALAFSPRPTAMGLLRIYDRFDILARLDMVIALIRLVLTALAWALGLGLWAFVGLFVLWTIADGLLPMFFALREMRRNGDRLISAAPRQVLAENPGLLRLFVNSNVSVTLRQLRQRLDVLLLSAVLPAAALGLYQLARRIGEAALRLGRPVGQIIYPEFSRMAAQGNYRALRRLLLIATGALTGVLALLLLPAVLAMPALLPLIFGPDFAAAVPSVNIMAAAVALYIAGMTCAPALMSLSRDTAMMVITAVTTAIFLLGLIPAARAWGAEGAAAMHLITNAIWLIACLWVALSASRSDPVEVRP